MNIHPLQQLKLTIIVTAFILVMSHSNHPLGFTCSLKDDKQKGRTKPFCAFRYAPKNAPNQPTTTYLSEYVPLSFRPQSQKQIKISKLNHHCVCVRFLSTQVVNAYTPTGSKSDQYACAPNSGGEECESAACCKPGSVTASIVSLKHSICYILIFRRCTRDKFCLHGLLITDIESN
jgi:hypothetical protein